MAASSPQCVVLETPGRLEHLECRCFHIRGLEDARQVCKGLSSGISLPFASVFLVSRYTIVTSSFEAVQGDTLRWGPRAVRGVEMWRKFNGGFRFDTNDKCSPRRLCLDVCCIDKLSSILFYTYPQRNPRFSISFTPIQVPRPLFLPFTIPSSHIGLCFVPA